MGIFKKYILPLVFLGLISPLFAEAPASQSSDPACQPPPANYKTQIGMKNAGAASASSTPQSGNKMVAPFTIDYENCTAGDVSQQSGYQLPSCFITNSADLKIRVRMITPDPGAGAYSGAWIEGERGGQFLGRAGGGYVEMTLLSFKIPQGLDNNDYLTIKYSYLAAATQDNNPATRRYGGPSYVFRRISQLTAPDGRTVLSEQKDTRPTQCTNESGRFGVNTGLVMKACPWEPVTIKVPIWALRGNSEVILRHVQENYTFDFDTKQYAVSNAYPLGTATAIDNVQVILPGGTPVGSLSDFTCDKFEAAVGEAFNFCRPLPPWLLPANPNFLWLPLRWDIKGPGGLHVPLQSDLALFTFPKSGFYDLKITDGAGGESKKIAKIYVNAASVPPPVLAPLPKSKFMIFPPTVTGCAAEGLTGFQLVKRPRANAPQEVVLAQVDLNKINEQQYLYIDGPIPGGPPPIYFVKPTYAGRIGTASKGEMLPAGETVSVVIRSFPTEPSDPSSFLVTSTSGNPPALSTTSKRVVAAPLAPNEPSYMQLDAPEPTILPFQKSITLTPNSKGEALGQMRLNVRPPDPEMADQVTPSAEILWAFSGISKLTEAQLTPLMTQIKTDTTPIALTQCKFLGNQFVCTAQQGSPAIGIIIPTPPRALASALKKFFIDLPGGSGLLTSATFKSWIEGHAKELFGNTANVAIAGCPLQQTNEGGFRADCNQDARKNYLSYADGMATYEAALLVNNPVFKNGVNACLEENKGCTSFSRLVSSRKNLYDRYINSLLYSLQNLTQQGAKILASSTDAILAPFVKPELKELERRRAIHDPVAALIDSAEWVVPDFINDQVLLSANNNFQPTSSVSSILQNVMKPYITAWNNVIKTEKAASKALFMFGLETFAGAQAMAQLTASGPCTGALISAPSCLKLIAEQFDLWKLTNPIDTKAIEDALTHDMGMDGSSWEYGVFSVVKFLPDVASAVIGLIEFRGTALALKTLGNSVAKEALSPGAYRLAAMDLIQPARELVIKVGFKMKNAAVNAGRTITIGAAEIAEGARKTTSAMMVVLRDDAGTAKLFITPETGLTPIVGGGLPPSTDDLAKAISGAVQSAETGGEKVKTLVIVNGPESEVSKALDSAFESGFTREEAIEETILGEAARNAGFSNIAIPKELSDAGVQVIRRSDGYLVIVGREKLDDIPERLLPQFHPPPERIVKMKPREGAFTQKDVRSTIGPEIQMRDAGKLKPITGVRMRNGTIAYFDNSRPVYAILTDMPEIEVAMYNFDDVIPIERAWSLKPPQKIKKILGPDVIPRTWGEAVEWRLIKNEMAEPARMIPLFRDLKPTAPLDKKRNLEQWPLRFKWPLSDAERAY